jgi:hypothetical protein
LVITEPGTDDGASTPSCSSSTQEEAARSVNVKSREALLIERECIFDYFLGVLDIASRPAGTPDIKS